MSNDMFGMSRSFSDRRINVAKARSHWLIGQTGAGPCGGATGVPTLTRSRQLESCDGPVRDRRENPSSCVFIARCVEVFRHSILSMPHDRANVIDLKAELRRGWIGMTR